jgi:hypothetical protein
VAFAQAGQQRRERLAPELPDHVSDEQQLHPGQSAMG